MNGRYLLDTNIVIAIFAHESAVLAELTRAHEVFIPSIVLGELYFGARKSGRAAENAERVEELARANSILDCDSDTAVYYGEIKNVLKLRGRPIPENDIWIAAIAKQHGLTLVTRDAHLHEVEGLTLVAW